VTAQLLKAPSKKCSARAAQPVLNDRILLSWLTAHYRVSKLSHESWEENGRKSLRIVLNFQPSVLADELQERAWGADGFIGGYLAAKGLTLN
jgi:hypothetical protein